MNAVTDADRRAAARIPLGDLGITCQWEIRERFAIAIATARAEGRREATR